MSSEPTLSLIHIYIRGCRLQPAGGDGKLILCPYVCAVESGMAYPCRKGGKREALASCRLLPVSYTHLDVYKRQGQNAADHHTGGTAQFELFQYDEGLAGICQ